MDPQTVIVSCKRKCLYTQLKCVDREAQELCNNDSTPKQNLQKQNKLKFLPKEKIPIVERQDLKSKETLNYWKQKLEKTLKADPASKSGKDLHISLPDDKKQSASSERDLQEAIFYAVANKCLYKFINIDFLPFVAAQIELEAFKRHLSDRQTFEILYNTDIVKRIFHKVTEGWRITSYEDVMMAKAYNEEMARIITYHPSYCPFSNETFSYELRRSCVGGKCSSFLSPFMKAVEWIAVALMAVYVVDRFSLRLPRWSR